MSRRVQEHSNKNTISLQPAKSTPRHGVEPSPDAIELDPREATILPADKPFSVLSRRQKLLIVALSSFAGLFSPISSVIYVPALPQVAKDFRQSTQNINLTITVYLIMQGIAPTVWGTLSDHLGRRIIYLTTLFVYVGSCIGLASTPDSSYWLLMLLRCMQSIGGSSVIAIGAGCVTDIATREERAGYLGIFGAGAMFGPAIGPVLGGVLAQSLSWRWIFWFLAIFSGVCWISILLFLPETLRTKVGDGSIPASPIGTPLFNLTFTRKRASDESEIDMTSRIPSKKFDLRLPIKLLLNPVVAALLFCTSLYYATYYCVLTMFSTLLQRYYGYNEVIIGLCYLSNGVGGIVSTLLTGRIMDRDYTTARLRLGDTDNIDNTAVDNLPIEKVRLRWMPVYVGFFLAAVIAFGWSMQVRANVAVPILMNFFIGYSATGMISITSTMVVDLFPGTGASVTASFNLVRCCIAAGAVALINPLDTAIGTGWAFVVASAICAASLPAIVFVLWKGPRIRQRRASDTVL